MRHYCLHTNGIESVWALFKRQIVGTHHWPSPKQISRYLGEMTWRFNLRELDEGDRVNALLAQTTGRLTYKELIVYRGREPREAVFLDMDPDEALARFTQTDPAELKRRLGVKKAPPKRGKGVAGRTKPKPGTDE